MIDLESLIVCAVCHVEMTQTSVGDDIRRCPQCERCYTTAQGVRNMIPDPVPDEVLISKWRTWQKLQENGVQSYTRAPEFNLSIGNREDAQAFGDFCRASGLILDIGCGPQKHPSYLPRDAQAVGIDPLLGEQPRAFSFVRGIGEYLPFRENSFDSILYASSLDHIIDPKRSLAEAVRCLKPGGRINLWIDGLAGDDPPVTGSRSKRYQTIAAKGVSSLLRHRWLSELGVRRTISYVGAVARMKVPEGANDFFHFVHLRVDLVLDWLKELNLATTRQQDYSAADSIFIQAKAREVDR